MAVDDQATVLLPGQGKTISFSGTFSGNQVRFVYAEPESTYSLVEWVAAPGAPAPPLHFHRAADEAFYVLEGTFRFQVGHRTFEGTAGAFVFVPRGIEHAFWNGGATAARMLATWSPPGFERYFEELAEGLAAAEDDAEAAISVRKALSEKHDIEFVGPPRRATG